jgi:hypothetical protein
MVALMGKVVSTIRDSHIINKKVSVLFAPSFAHFVVKKKSKKRPLGF